MVFYQFQQTGNEEFQSMKKWNSVVGIVAAGANGTVAAGERTVNFAIDECLKHSDYTRVSLAFSCCFGIIYIVLGVRSLI